MEIIRDDAAGAKEWWVCYTAAWSAICCIIFTTILLLLHLLIVRPRPWTLQPAPYSWIHQP